ncbi:porin [Sulfitobacter guttiformis]|uniref:Porin-like protein n=1 Tax=Sulfitobacter guttiformis TaxID=74349 RepID=A0A420DI06_9RHOB|nr:porin [Sulfitobacter guttiformis]KIN72381.1 hypothetical protein Z949_1554 [Sulfitobacter guttiformis KCTC 32187]RKE93863.1 porin-like protein [Sulfitobacter guttiformis]
MQKSFLTAGLYGLVLAGGSSVMAQDAGFIWGGSVEVGIDSTVKADDPTAEVTDTYISADVAFEAAITDRITAFGGLSLESVTDAVDNRAFEDMGLYVSELGLRFGFGETLVSVGKISPVFGKAWDEAPGFYGTSLAEDYELSEMIGVTVNTPLSSGVLSFAAFYVDDTALSNSVGNKRGRNSVANGGLANTGKFDNVSLQFAQEFGATSAWVGLRHLTAGVGNSEDETAVAVGASHDFGTGLSMIGEVVRFDNAGGEQGYATYTTLGGAYALDAWTFSATATLVNAADSTDRMYAVGVDRSLTDAIDVNFGLARFDVGGAKSTAVGLAAVVSF